MPNGKEHHQLWKDNRVAAVVVSAASIVPGYYATGSMETALALSLSSMAGYYMGTQLSPDLDLISIDTVEARWKKTSSSCR